MNMKKSFITLMVLAAIAVPVLAQSESYIEVRGTAEKTVTPDKITMSITIREKDYRNLSLPDMEKEMKSVLRKAGVDLEKDLKVTDMSSQFLKQRARTQDVLQTKQYSLHLKSASMAGKVLDALDGIGVSNVYISKSEYSAMDSVKLDVKAEAVANAKKTAQAMVGAVGQELGQAFYIMENDGWNDGYSPRIMMAAKSVSNSADEVEMLPELLFDDIKVTSRVTVRFRLP